MCKNYFIHFIYFLAGFVLFTSCTNDSTGDSVIEEPDKVIAGTVNATVFTATISGNFSGISKVDLALGKSGVLYCEKTANALDIFRSWKDGNDTPDCIVFDKGKVSGETYSGVITDLEPDTEYSFCLFSQGQEKSKREISSVQTFRTKTFEPEIQVPSISNIHYIDAKVQARVIIDDADVPYCQMGILLSQTPDGNEGNSSLFSCNDFLNGTASVELKGIKPNKDYYCRLLVKYKTQNGKTGSIYGPEKTFKTKDIDNTAVDLGLPSGIRWAEFSMYEYEFASHVNLSPFFYWGSSKPLFSYLDSKGERYIVTEEEYEYVDSNGELMDLGDEISGTEYDIVHKIYGGKWRMPKKEDLEELIANCSISSKKTLRKERSWYNAESKKYETYTEEIMYFEVKGGSNSIKLRLYDTSWSGTKNTEDNTVYYLSCRTDANLTPSVKVRTTERKDVRLSIRPVWDPNMTN